MNRPPDITGSSHNRVVVTLIADGEGNVAVVHNNKQERFRSIDAALGHAREILHTNEDEKAAFDKEMEPAGEDEHSQGAAR